MKLESNQAYQRVLSELDLWGSYEATARSRDISKLDGIQKLLRDLGNPEDKFKIIHVAGTNGKGLTSTMISHLLSVQGYSSGCYTSPHLIDIRERISIDGVMISKDLFVDSAECVLDIARSYRGLPYLSYFDVLTAIALVSFQNLGMDWVVLETGLGGRADSTNVTKKELCVLTRIGFDHQEVLGADLKGIAKEKMGITRSGIPTVVSKQTDELDSWLLQQLETENVPAHTSEATFNLLFQTNNHSEFLTHFNSDYSEPWKECARTSLSVMQLLFGSSENSAEIMKNQKIWLKTIVDVQMNGRLDYKKGVYWQKKQTSFDQIIFDGGHNEDALEALYDFINKKKIKSFVLILGMAADKVNDNIKSPLEKLCQLAEKVILTPILSPRTATSKHLSEFLETSVSLKKEMQIIQVEGAEQALNQALSQSLSPLVIAGSFYLVGEMLQILET